VCTCNLGTNKRLAVDGLFLKFHEILKGFNEVRITFGPALTLLGWDNQIFLS
jgi:hypothetical protein